MCLLAGTPLEQRADLLVEAARLRVGLDAQLLIEDLTALLIGAQGIGLAAEQVVEAHQIAVSFLT